MLTKCESIPYKSNKIKNEIKTEINIIETKKNNRSKLKDLVDDKLKFIISKTIEYSIVYGSIDSADDDIKVKVYNIICEGVHHKTIAPTHINVKNNISRIMQDVK